MIATLQPTGLVGTPKHLSVHSDSEAARDLAKDNVDATAPRPMRKAQILPTGGCRATTGARSARRPCPWGDVAPGVSRDSSGR
jgi:hypothetical protein